MRIRRRPAKHHEHGHEHKHESHHHAHEPHHHAHEPHHHAHEPHHHAHEPHEDHETGRTHEAHRKRMHQRYRLTGPLALLSPYIAIASGALASWLAHNIPGLAHDLPATTQGITQALTFVVGTLASALLHHKYLDGAHKWESGLLHLEASDRIVRSRRRARREEPARQPGEEVSVYVENFVEDLESEYLDDPPAAYTPDYEPDYDDEALLEAARRGAQDG